MRRLLDYVTIGADGRAIFDTPPIAFNYTGGNFRPPMSGKTLAVPDPLTGQTSFHLALSQADDCREAVTYMNNFPLGTDSLWPVEDRGKVFLRTGQLLEQYRDKLRAIIQLEMPKSAAEADNELAIAIDFFMSMGPHRVRNLYSPQDGGPGFGYCTDSSAHFSSWGPVSMIFPFNYPHEIPALQVGGALACGNVVTIKPHEYCPLSSQALLEVLLEAGMPKDFLQIINGYGPDVSLLATHPDIQRMLFTGSSRVAHQLANPRLLSEQSGINWIFMFPYKADVSVPAESVAKSAFGLSGQRCSTARLLFVDQSWLDQGLLHAIRKYAEDNYKFEDFSLPALMSWSTKRSMNEMVDMQKRGINLLWGGEPVVDHAYLRPEHAPQGRFHYGAITPSLFLVNAQVLQEPEVAARLREERFFPNLVVVSYDGPKECEMIFKFALTLPERLTCGIGTDNFQNVLWLRDHMRMNGVTNWGIAPWTTGAEAYKRFGPIGGASIGGSNRDIQDMWMARYGIHSSMKNNQLVLTT